MPLLLVGCNQNNQSSGGSETVTDQYINVPITEVSLMEEKTYQIETQIIKAETLVFYSSNNEEIASVTDNGLVTANKVGETTINVRGGRDSYIVFITVTPYQAEASLQIILEKDTFTLEKDDEYILPLTVKLGNEIIDNPHLSYTYEVDGIVSIIGTTVTATMVGTTKCVATATYENKEVSKSFTITVY